MTSTTHSPTSTDLLAYAERLFAPLVREGVYENFERAFRALLLDYIERQISVYTAQVVNFETRHQQSFESYTTSLVDRATPEQEEVWMDWEVALTFLNKWQSIRSQVSANGSTG